MRADRPLRGAAVGAVAPRDPGAALLQALARERRAREALEQAELEVAAAAAQVAAGRAAVRAAAMAELVARAGHAQAVTAREAAALAELARQAEERLAGGVGPAAGRTLVEPAAPGPRDVAVWDPFVRLFHWGVAGAFVANAFVTEPGKPVHLGLGYGVAALVALRVLWGFVGPRPARFAAFWPRPADLRRQLAEMIAWKRAPHAGHSPLGALMILNLLVSLAGVAVTGHMLTTVAYFGVGWVGEVHESLVLWIKVSVALHVLAVLVESRRLGVNLAKSMITGRKRLG